jgi:hypothetical protein
MKYETVVVEDKSKGNSQPNIHELQIPVYIYTSAFKIPLSYRPSDSKNMAAR